MNCRGSARRAARLVAVASAAIAALVLGAAASASAGTLDQQQTSFNNDLGLVTSQSGAQTFTAGISGKLDEADLNLSNVGTPPATVTVEIRTTAAGIPTATVLATGTIATSAIGEDRAFVPVTFATPAAVTAGTQYALLAYTPGSFGNAVGWSAQDTGNPYSGGELLSSGDALPPGVHWNGAPTEDLAFKTFVVPAPPAPPAPPARPGPTAPPSTPSTSTSTGQRAAALKRCKKRAIKRGLSKQRLKKCKKKANLLPV